VTVDSSHVFISGGGESSKQTYYLTYPDFGIEPLDDWADYKDTENAACGLFVNPEGKRCVRTKVRKYKVIKFRKSLTL